MVENGNVENSGVGYDHVVQYVGGGVPALRQDVQGVSNILPHRTPNNDPAKLYICRPGIHSSIGTHGVVRVNERSVRPTYCTS